MTECTFALVAAIVEFVVAVAVVFPTVVRVGDGDGDDDDDDDYGDDGVPICDHYVFAVCGAQLSHGYIRSTFVPLF